MSYPQDIMYSAAQMFFYTKFNNQLTLITIDGFGNPDPYLFLDWLAD